MTPEIVVALLAIAKIGGVILPLFSGYGAGAIVTRLVDADAKALFTADGFFRRGKAVAMKPTADEAAAQVPTLEHMIVLHRADIPVAMQAGRDHWWHDLIAPQPAEAETEVTSAEDVLMVIYTSAPPGKPKGAVHTHCGFPVKAAQDMAFGTDVHPGDVIYWMTDMGWMMGPWLVFGALCSARHFFIYDGAPDYPGPDRLWAMVERHQITQLGVSPTLDPGAHPTRRRAGQDPRSLFAAILCLHRRAMEPRSVAVAVQYGRRRQAADHQLLWRHGNLRRHRDGQPDPAAETVLLLGGLSRHRGGCGRRRRAAGPQRGGRTGHQAPWIGMTRGFWKDPQRYLDTYWSRWENVWVHGDFAAIDGDGLWYILGRSDDTIKVAGKRLGPAEVESVLVDHPAVVEAAAIGVPDAVKGTSWSFSRCARGARRTDALRDELRASGHRSHGQTAGPESDPVRQRPAQDAQRQSDAPHGPRGLPGRGPGRHVRS